MTAITGALACHGLAWLVGLLLARAGLDGKLAIYAGCPIAAALAGGLVSTCRGARYFDAGLAGALGVLVALLWIKAPLSTTLPLAAGAGVLALISGPMLAAVAHPTVTAFGLGAATSLGITLIVALLLMETRNVNLAIYLSIAVGVFAGGFAAQWVLPRRNILMCGAGLVAILAFGTLSGLRLFDGVIYAIGALGFAGAWLAWALRSTAR